MEWWLFLFSLIMCTTISGMDGSENQENNASADRSNDIYENCYYKEAQEYFTCVSDEELTKDFLAVIKNLSVSENERHNFARAVVYMGHAAQRDNAEEYAHYYNFLTDCVTDWMNGKTIDNDKWNAILPFEEVRRKTM